MVRTPREWDEPCRECGGTGTVHRRESFSLWTPEEYAKTMGEYGHGAPKVEPESNGADSVPSNAMVCEVHGGASIWDACREGVALARVAGRPVVFTFNGTVAVCHVDSEPVDVSTKWHLLFNAQR